MLGPLDQLKQLSFCSFVEILYVLRLTKPIIYLKKKIRHFQLFIYSYIYVPSYRPKFRANCIPFFSPLLISFRWAYRPPPPYSSILPRSDRVLLFAAVPPVGQKKNPKLINPYEIQLIDLGESIHLFAEATQGRIMYDLNIFAVVFYICETYFFTRL